MGYRACVNATGDPVEMGQIGAGTGATVGKLRGFSASNGGVGSACCVLESGLIVAAIVVVNVWGLTVAGAKNKDTGEFVDIVTYLCDQGHGAGMRFNQRDQTQLWASLQRMPRLTPQKRRRSHRWRTMAWRE